MEQIIPNQKHCSRCGIEKPIESGFYKSKLFKSGYAAQCRDCTKAQSKKWCEDNPDRKRENDRLKTLREKISRVEVLCSCGCGLMTRNASKGMPFYRGHSNRGRVYPSRNPGFPEGVMLDDEDRERLGGHSWSIDGRGYLQRHARTVAGKPTKITLHREIVGAEATGLVVDHINGNKLDNRRCNLRAVNIQINAQNRATAETPSGVRGVSWNKKTSKWYAHAKVDGKMISLGFYDKIHDAISVATEYRRTHYRGYVNREP